MINSGGDLITPKAELISEAGVGSLVLEDVGPQVSINSQTGATIQAN
jgi:hypothetical protein